MPRQRSAPWTRPSTLSREHERTPSGRCGRRVLLRRLSFAPGREKPATGVPARSFTTIAGDPDVYTQRLRASLEKPHWPMGGLILSPSDIDNILAYLATLRRRR